ncbi:MAG: HlyD family secretion protein [Maribacter sp.]
MSDQLDDIELRSEEVKDILTKVPHWLIRRGSVLFLTLIALIMALSWFIKYPDIITSEAILTTQIPPQKEYAKISGKISAIRVKDKQKVQKNEVLAVIENSADQNDVYLLKLILDTLEMNRDSIFFPFKELPLLFLGDIESDFAQFENNYFQFVLNRDLDPFSNEALANEISIVELRRRLQNLSGQQGLASSELSFKKKDLERTETLFSKGIISAQEYENKQSEYLNSQREYRNTANTVSQLRESLSNMDNTSKGADFNRKREETRLLKNVIQSYNQLRKSVKEWELKYVFKSNIEGNVSFLNYWNTNQSVNTGDLVFTILPNTSSAYVAKLKTPSSNSGKIEVGQKVNVSLFDYPEYEFGVLKGSVTSISSVSSKEGIYIVDVSIPSELTTSFGKQLEFKQEMKGKADIITEDLRLLERLLYQFREVFKR